MNVRSTVGADSSVSLTVERVLVAVIPVQANCGFGLVASNISGFRRDKALPSDDAGEALYPDCDRIQDSRFAAAILADQHGELLVELEVEAFEAAEVLQLETSQAHRCPR